MAIVTASSLLGGGVKSSQRGLFTIPSNSNSTMVITLATSVSSGKYQFQIYNSTGALGLSNSSFSVTISGTSITLTQAAFTLWNNIFVNAGGSGATYLMWELTEFY